MIVVTGNWLISDGTLFPPPSGGAIERLLGDLPRLGCLAGIAADGTYRPIERLDLVLAGDTFDGLASRRWLGRLRPWHGGAACRETGGHVLYEAVRSGRGTLARLGAVSRSGIRVPASDRRRRPILERTVPVPVRVAVLPGDRDLLLEGPLADAAGRFGFDVGSCWERIGEPDGHVLVRHGHEADPLCVAEADPADVATGRRPPQRRRLPSLSESLVIDCLAVFAASVAETPCPAAVTARILRGLARGPWTAAPTILARVLGEAALPADTTRTLLDAWRRSVDRWHAAATAEPPGSVARFDAVGALASWLRRVDVTHDDAGPRPVTAPPCADGWLDIRRRDLVFQPTRSGLVVLGHPPRGLSHGSIITLGPEGCDAESEHRDAHGGPMDVSSASEGGRGPVVEIRSRGSETGDAAAWVAIPWRGTTRGLVSSSDWAADAA